MIFVLRILFVTIKSINKISDSFNFFLKGGSMEFSCCAVPPFHTHLCLQSPMKESKKIDLIRLQFKEKSVHMYFAQTNFVNLWISAMECTAEPFAGFG